MPEELKLIPTADAAPPRTSLLRRLFRLKDIGFYLMIALAWFGAAYTDADAQGSRWYWHGLIPVFGLICIITQWPYVEPTVKARALLVLRQILHWGGLLLLMQLVFVATTDGFMDALDDRQASFLLMLNVTLTTFLAGLYFNWRLCVVALFLGIGAVFMVVMQNIAPILVYAGITAIAVYLLWSWWYTRWQTRRTDPAEA
ncbi:MAG: hypothetical protein KDJ31_11975 [Candidatus Competibacteraceae bacterium]|nr:hypothetical protein [Candidatus Competibacteraceae bacterium]MCB1820686.1 hypothetical protein [Candidatus Competibacteraceae bacterium]HRY14523.1 hypothetical protein [Candidatus Competibacteraceae bacterium]